MVHATSDGVDRNRRLRVGMVGGGRNAFIGAVHRMALRLDDAIELRAGALSATTRACRAPISDWPPTGSTPTIARWRGRKPPGLTASRR